MRGGPPAPRRRLHPDFLAKIHAARVAGLRASSLAANAGFPHYPDFARVLHAEAVPATPLTLARLREVARMVGFDGDLFLDSEAGA